MLEDYQEIYILDDPRTQLVRYVGISGNALRRYKQHIEASHSFQLRAWNTSLKHFQLTPGVTVIDDASSRGEGLEKEAFWIQWFLRHGAPLLNEQRPALTVERTIAIFENLASSRWRDLDRSMGEITRAIISGQRENLSYKDLASVEWRLFNAGEYRTLYASITGEGDGRDKAHKESLQRFGIPLYQENRR